MTSAYQFPWLELAVAIPLAGAAAVGLMRDAVGASRWAIGFTGATLAAALMACLGYYYGPAAAGDPAPWELLARATGTRYLALDELSAPLLPLTALLHFLTAVATARVKLRRFSFAWSLATDAMRMAMFGGAADQPWLLIGLLAVNVLPPYLDMRSRGAPTRVYALHMVLFVVLLAAGGFGLTAGTGPGSQPEWATVLLLLAVLVRCGTIPVHVWVTDLFEHASFGTALLYVAPLPGVFAGVRLVLPAAPDWALQGIGLMSMATAVYAAGMALVQRESRRFFAYLFLSHSSLVLVGLELHTPIALCGALCLWFSVALSLTGFGLTIRALEARLGRLGLTDFHGLYDHAPALAVCFLLTGLACVGFPGTLGYVAAELLVDGAIETNPAAGVAVVLATALNGIAVVRAYFLLFTGTRHPSAVPLNIRPRERFAVLTVAAIILGGGLYPQPGVASRYAAAEAVLATRSANVPEAAEPPDE